MSTVKSMMTAKKYIHSDVGCVRGLQSATHQPRLTGPAKYRDLHPTPDSKYISDPRTANWKVLRSIESSVTPPAVVTEYDHLFGRVPHT